jgi:hypothetical protein
MCDFMSEHHGQAVLVVDNGQQFIDYKNVAAECRECVLHITIDNIETQLQVRRHIHLSGHFCAKTLDVSLQFRIGIVQQMLFYPLHMRRDKLPLTLMTDKSNPVWGGSYRYGNDCGECERSDRNDIQEAANALRLARIDFVDVVANCYSIAYFRSRIVRDDMITNTGIILATFTLETLGLLSFRRSPFSV